MENCIEIAPNGKCFINPSAAAELEENNCTFPDIDHVLYNLKTEEYKRDEDGKIVRDANNQKVKVPMDKPILNTTVFFIDGTKVSVLNSANDPVKLTTKTLSNGKEITVADNESKEHGLIYAIIKRLVSKPDNKGRMADAGLGRILNDLVSNAYDTQIEEAEAKIAKDKSKAEYEAKKNTPKKVRYSINGTLERINKLLDLIEADPKSADKTVLKNLVNMFKD